MIIYVDIDETICTNEENRDYSKAKPIQENIRKINRLHDQGHEITYWSARGTGTGIDWTPITVEQLKRWGVKYHHLSLGEKPIFDLLIDDKVLNIHELTNDIETLEYQKFKDSVHSL